LVPLPRPAATRARIGTAGGTDHGKTAKEGGVTLDTSRRAFRLDRTGKSVKIPYVKAFGLVPEKKLH